MRDEADFVDLTGPWSATEAGDRLPTQGPRLRPPRPAAHRGGRDRHVIGLSRHARAGHGDRPPGAGAVPDVQLLIGAIAQGYQIAERPVVMRRRTAGVKKGGNAFYGLRYARVVVRTWWRERGTQPASTRGA